MAIKKMTEMTKTTAEATTQGFDETMSALKSGMSGAAATFEKSQSEMKFSMEKAMKTAEEMMSFSQGNVEAAIKSSQILAAGVQDMGKSLTATAQAQFEQTMSTWKTMTSIRSFKEAMELQASLTRNAFEGMVAQSGKMTDASLKLAEQAMAPLTARVSVAVETFSRAV